MKSEFNSDTKKHEKFLLVSFVTSLIVDILATKQTNQTLYIKVWLTVDFKPLFCSLAVVLDKILIEVI